MELQDDSPYYDVSQQHNFSSNIDPDHEIPSTGVNLGLSATTQMISAKRKHRRGKRRHSRVANVKSDVDASCLGVESFNQNVGDSVDHDDNVLEINVQDFDCDFDLNKYPEIYTFYANYSADSQCKSKWILDSGATLHMCRDKHLFFNLKISQNAMGHVFIANGIPLPILGIGKVKIESKNTMNGKKFALILHDVAYIPKIQVNLVSAQRLAKSAGKITIDSSYAYITIDNNETRIATFNGSSYIVDEGKMELPKYSADLCIHDYHRMLSHRNLEDIRTQNFPDIKRCKCSDECEACIKGKATRKPFPKSSEKPQTPFDIIVSDLCGPLNVQSPSKSLYFMTFIDACSGYTEVSFLKHKSQAKDCIIHYVEKMKNILNMKPKIFRSDSGGEYIDKQLVNYLQSEGIVVQNTVHDSSQQNGIAERANRTLMDAVRTMLIAANLPSTLWAEALNNAVYNFNRLRGDHKNYSPIEIFFNKPCSRDFHVFGEKVFVTSKSQGRRKLDPRANEMWYLGVDRKSKGYRLWDGHSVRVERDVRFLRNKEITPTNDTNETSNPLNNVVEPPTEPVLRRSERIQKQSNVAIIEHKQIPKTFKQAVNSVDKDMWNKAMLEELSAIERNSTWTLMDLPKHRKAIGCRWVFSIKKDAAGEPIRYKARLVAQGFTQVWGEDYNEVYAPVTRSSSFRILLSQAGINKYFIRQFDVTTAFLNGSLKEEIFMEQPPGFSVDGRVCKLNKSLYGLKQAAKEWYDKLNKVLLSIGFKRSDEDPCMYKYQADQNLCYVIVHVDDFLFGATSDELIEMLAKKIGQFFELKDCGEVKHFLGIDIYKEHDGVYAINQETYINQIARELQLENVKPHYYPLDPGYHQIDDDNYLENNHQYRKIIGMLIYVSTNSRPDIAASVGILSQRVSKPRKIDLTESLRVVKYLITSKQLKLRLSNCCQEITAYTDADYAGDRTDYKSRSGFTCFVNGGLIEWMSRKQTAFASSSTEAEYYALCETAKEVVYLKKILAEFDIKTASPVNIFCDNQSTLAMLHGEKFSRTTKHMAVKFHYLKDILERQIINVSYVPTTKNISDLLTKPLPRHSIEKFRKMIGLV